MPPTIFEGLELLGANYGNGMNYDKLESHLILQAQDFLGTTSVGPVEGEYEVI